MDSLEVNKVCAAVLVGGIGWMAATLIADALVRPEELAKTAINIEIPTASTATATAAVAAALPPIAPFLAKADPAAGKEDVQKFCSACHNFTKGAGAKIGPDLYGVVGRDVASQPGFSYSDALKKHHGPWTFEELNHWLHNPQDYAPGTKMGFGGIASEQQRANVIDYLRTLSDHPEPLPPVTAAAPKPAAAAAATSAAAPPPGVTPAEAKAAGSASFASLLAKADPAAGKADTEKFCTVCHNFNEGGGTKIGPDLYGVVGRPVASFPGFNYTSALKAHHGPWTFQELNVWLRDPAAYAPGTMMAFPGIKSEKQRANVVAYLRTLSKNPEPLPAANGAVGVQTGNSVKGTGGAVTPPGQPGPKAAPAMPPQAGAPNPASPAGMSK